MGENQVQQGLYSQSFEHDNCGIGAVVNIKGRKDHQIVADALKIVEQLEHRAGKDAEGKTGDGVGILTQISHRFFSRVCQEIGIELGGEREYRRIIRQVRIRLRQLYDRCSLPFSLFLYYSSYANRLQNALICRFRPALL